jgi:hypothetical protein
MRTFRNSATAYAQVTDDEFARNISPLGQLVNTTNQWVYFSSWLPERSPGAGHEYATSVYIWQQGQSSTNAIRLDMTSGQLQVPYYITNRVWIRYTYPSGFGQKVNQFGQPYWWYYGGKGG